MKYLPLLLAGCWTGTVAPQSPAPPPVAQTATAEPAPAAPAPVAAAPVAAAPVAAAPVTAAPVEAATPVTAIAPAPVAAATPIAAPVAAAASAPASAPTENPQVRRGAAATTLNPKLYLQVRGSLGYGHFDYAGVIEDGGSVTHRPSTASGATLGAGASVGWRVRPNLAVGATLNFDPMFGASGSDDEGNELTAASFAMPNGTIGGVVAWEATPQLTFETAAAFGGGGVQGLPGGMGLQLHGQTAYYFDCGNAECGPMARVSYGLAMFDPVRGGSLNYYAIDLGMTIRLKRL